MTTTNPFQVYNQRLVIAMVGLPARGKSYLSHVLLRYLNFVGCPCQLFNAGNLRRERGMAGADANFFDPTNSNAKQQRDEMAMQCLDEVIAWIKSKTVARGCAVGILDATNTTVARRKKVMDRVKKERDKCSTWTLIFVESIANEPKLLDQNYRMKLSNDDYKNSYDKQAALADFIERVKQYETVYEPLSDKEQTSYIQLVNAGAKFISSNVDGYVMWKVQRLLGSVHIGPRTIWIGLVGQTENDLQGRLGGDASLTNAGIAYGKEMSNVINTREQLTENDLSASALNLNHVEPTLVLTGTLHRYAVMSSLLLNQNVDGTKTKQQQHQFMTLAALNELCAGDMSGLTNLELMKRFPKECDARAADKLNYRYPGVGGESYIDLVARMNEIVCMLEQSRGNSIVICDRSVFRALMAYFLGKTIQELPFLHVKPGVLELRRSWKGFSVTQLDVTIGKPTSIAGAGTEAISDRSNYQKIFDLSHQCCVSDNNASF